MSMPVKSARRLPDGTPALTDEVVGVVNVDSKMTGARRFYDSSTVDGKTLLDVQKEVLAEASEFCSYLMS